MPKKQHPKPGDWDFKVLVWKRATLGERPAGILRHFQLKAGTRGYPEEPPDRETIRNTLKELDSLLPEVVEKLPPDVRAYAISRRPELKAELERSKQESVGQQTNWIEVYQAKHGRLPVLPKPLQPLVGNSNQPISKDMPVGIASIQLWNAIKRVRGLEKKWREFLEWKGEDPDEYEYKVNRLRPPGGPGPIQLTYKQPHPR